jgi:hypothetical protein
MAALQSFRLPLLPRDPVTELWRSASTCLVVTTMRPWRKGRKESASGGIGRKRPVLP